MDTNKLLTLLIKTSARQEGMLEVICGMSAAHSRLLERGLPRCAAADCSVAATVRDIAHYEIVSCDHCAASEAVAGMCTEDQWIDLALAKQIRFLQDYLAQLDLVSTDKPDPPKLLH